MLILSGGIFLQHLCFIAMFSVLNKLSEYIYTYQKMLLHAPLLLVFCECTTLNAYRST